MNKVKFSWILAIYICINYIHANSQTVNADSLKTVILPTIPSATFNVTTYGAVSSASIDNTTAIQNAINAAGAAGGGTVMIPAGTFLSGPLTMKSKVHLKLSCSTTLKLLPYGTYPGSGSTGDFVAFINCAGLNNVKISGWGTIDGQGAAWWTAYNISKADATVADIGRPTVIGFSNTSYIEVSGITILNAPNTNIGVGKQCSHCTFFGVTITAPESSPNTDGINVWSPFVNIISCNISNGDDNIALNGDCAYLKVANCKFGTGHGCSIGSYASNVHHITVTNCTFNGTSTGIRMKASRDRGGLCRYLRYSNITMTNVDQAISVVSYYPNTPSTPTSDAAQTITATTPNWQNIEFKNIVATGSTRAATLWGLPELSISNVIFDNVQISAATGMTANFASGVVFKNGSKITVTSGNAFLSTYQSTISGINTTTGLPQ